MNKRILLVGLLALLPASRSYGSIIYTDQSSFLKQMLSGFYLETFDGLTGLRNLGNDLYFSSTNYSYWGHASGGYSYGNGQFYGGYLNNGDDKVLMASVQGTDFEFDFLNGNISAVGGTFFLQDDDQMVTTGTMHVTLQDGTQVTINGDTPFYGFTSTTPITQIIVDSNRLSAINNLYVGTNIAAIPEPSSSGLLAAGIGLIFLGRYRRSLQRKRT
jgi:hypothetical protein